MVAWKLKPGLAGLWDGIERWRNQGKPEFEVKRFAAFGKTLRQKIAWFAMYGHRCRWFPGRGFWFLVLCFYPQVWETYRISSCLHMGFWSNYDNTSLDVPDLRLVMRPKMVALRSAFVFFARVLVKWGWKKPGLLLRFLPSAYRAIRGPVYSQEVMEWLFGQSEDHAFRYYMGQIPVEEIPSGLLA